MGQACKGNILSCMDCASGHTHEIISEPSAKFELARTKDINESKESFIHTLNKLDRPLDLYEKLCEINEKAKAKERKSLGSENHSPRVKIRSSNFREHSINLIDKLSRSPQPFALAQD